MSMTYSDHICADFQGTSAETWDQELHEHLKLKLDEAQAELSDYKALLADEKNNRTIADGECRKLALEIARLNGILASHKLYEDYEAELTALKAENERLTEDRDKYAKAMELVLTEGLFLEKQKVKEKLSEILGVKI